MDDVHEGGMNYGCIYFPVSFYRDLNNYYWRFNLILLGYFQRMRQIGPFALKMKAFKRLRSLVLTHSFVIVSLVFF